MSSFTDRVVLITGAASGIGRTLARLFVGEGARVAGLDLTEEPLRTLAGELSAERFAWAMADVTDRTALARAVSDLEKRLGPPDLLIASAGVGRATPADPYDAEEIERQIRVNLIGVSNSIGAVLPGMLQRGHGHLVALSSLASYRGLPRMAAYCASKAGVSSLLEAIRVEVAPRGIAVTALCPGWIRTPMTDNIGVPHPFMMDLEAAAQQMLHAIRRRVPHLAFPAPSRRRVTLLRWLPASWSDWLVRRLVAAHTRDSERPPTG